MRQLQSLIWLRNRNTDIRKLKFIFCSCKLISLNRDAYKTNVYVISHHLVCFILQCQCYKDACFMSMTRMFCKNVATKAKKCKRHLHLASLHTKIIVVKYFVTHHKFLSYATINQSCGLSNILRFSFFLILSHIYLCCWFKDFW